MYFLRVRFQQGGAHVHAEFYMGKGSSPDNTTLGRCGSLVFREDEWKVFVDILNGQLPDNAICELIPV